MLSTSVTLTTLFQTIVMACVCLINFYNILTTNSPMSAKALGLISIHKSRYFLLMKMRQVRQVPCKLLMPTHLWCKDSRLRCWHLLWATVILCHRLLWRIIIKINTNYVIILCTPSSLKEAWHKVMASLKVRQAMLSTSRLICSQQKVGLLPYKMIEPQRQAQR